MFELTEEQRRTLERGEAIHLRDHGHDFVLLPADLYQKFKEDYDAEPWTDEERDLLRQEAVDLLDDGNPA